MFDMLLIISPKISDFTAKLSLLYKQRSMLNNSFDISKFYFEEKDFLML